MRAAGRCSGSRASRSPRPGPSRWCSGAGSWSPPTDRSLLVAADRAAEGGGTLLRLLVLPLRLLGLRQPGPVAPLDRDHVLTFGRPVVNGIGGELELAVLVRDPVRARRRRQVGAARADQGDLTVLRRLAVDQHLPAHRVGLGVLPA